VSVCAASDGAASDGAASDGPASDGAASDGALALEWATSAESSMRSAVRVQQSGTDRVYSNTCSNIPGQPHPHKPGRAVA
jgi:hypothetical protein